MIAFVIYVVGCIVILFECIVAPVEEDMQEQIVYEINLVRFSTESTLQVRYMIPMGMEENYLNAIVEGEYPGWEIELMEPVYKN
jgi:hypothetical protein